MRWLLPQYERRSNRNCPAFVSSNTQVKNSGFNLTNNSMFCSNCLKWRSYYPAWRQRSKSEVPIAGDRFLAPNRKVKDTKCFNFHRLQSVMVFRVNKPIFLEYLMLSPVRKCNWSHESRVFPAPQKPHWLIQVSGAPNDMKGKTSKNELSFILLQSLCFHNSVCWAAIKLGLASPVTSKSEVLVSAHHDLDALLSHPRMGCRSVPDHLQYFVG